MNVITPLLGSQHAADIHQGWQLAGVWRRAMNLLSDSGELLTLHRQGSGIGPGGWVIRQREYDALRERLHLGIKPQAVSDGIVLGETLITRPRRRCSLRMNSCDKPVPLGRRWMLQAEETGLSGPLWQAVSEPLRADLRQFSHGFRSALAGGDVDWSLWLGKGPGLTPSQDDMLTGMLLAAWYFNAIDPAGGRRFFAASGSIEQVTTFVSVSYLRYAAQGCFASPLLHFTRALRQTGRLAAAVQALLALGHTSGADTLLGFWLGQHIIQG